MTIRLLSAGQAGVSTTPGRMPTRWLAMLPISVPAQHTHKPPLHGQEWMAITGKPLGATAGARIFLQGGNAACAMLAATATMWDVLHWGGETQALIFDPRAKKVVGINTLGVAPTARDACRRSRDTSSRSARRSRWRAAPCPARCA